MADLQTILKRVRSAIGDLGEKIRLTLPGGKDYYETGYPRITDVVVSKVEDSTITDLVEGVDYTLDAMKGTVTLTEPLPPTATLLVTATAYALFDDEELTWYIEDAVRRHTHDRETSKRVRTENGFIKVVREPITLENLPEIEIEPLVVLSTIEVLYAMLTDAASDVDVVTAEGTHLFRSQRYNQLLNLITVLKQRYDEFCQALNIGLNRIQVTTLRRVSLTTGRLVPVFAPREYDEYSPTGPRRLLPPVDAPDEDPSGLPSPIWGGWGP